MNRSIHFKTSLSGWSLYPVHENPASVNDAKVLHKEPSNEIPQLIQLNDVEDLEAASSQNITISETNTIKNEVSKGFRGKMEDKHIETKSENMEDMAKFDCQVAQDSKEDDDLYLSSCRVFLAGFEEKELRKLVNMRKGGKTLGCLACH